MTSAQAQRAQAAVKAMKLIGFDQGVAKTVLKKLLKVYENNWEYIEAENYRLLADSILDNQESKDPEASEKDVAVSQEPNLSRKRLRRKQEDPGPSQLAIEPVFDSSSIPDKLIDEACNDVSENYDVPFSVQPPYAIYTAEEDEAHKGGISLANASPGLIYSPNMQLIPNCSNGVEGFQVSAHTEDISELANAHERYSTNVDIASSNMGEVKLSLTYNSDCPDFKMPSLESIFKMFEDRCLKSYKILQPNFSVVNLMKEICQCAADLSAESGKDPKEDIIKVTPPQESSKRSRSSGVHHGMTRRSSTRSVNSVTVGTPWTSMHGFESSRNVDSVSNDIQGNSLMESSCLSPSQTLAIIPSHEHACIVPVPQHDEIDIAKGEERVRISVINEFTSEKFPPCFHYIPQNAIYQNAHVNFSLARIGDEDCCINCFGDCLSAPIQCACTRETGGEFVYTLDGLLKKEFLSECISMNHDPDKHHHVYCKDCPIEKSKNEHMPDTCKGHLVRKFIKECWSKCGCNKQCGNRLVQRGITRKLQVFYTGNGKGWGLRTLEDLPRGAFVCEYVGEILTNIELYNRTVQRIGSAKHTYPVLLDADWGSEAGLRDEEALCLDATFYGNVGRFVNHRCVDATLVEVPVEWETPDHHYYHLAFFTTKKVEALEELTWDYGIDFDDRTHPIKAFKCLCGSRFCRDGRQTKIGSRASGWK